MAKWSSKPVTLKAIEFDGDTVVCTAKRLLVEDMQLLTKFYDRDKGKIVFTDHIEVCVTAKNILPKYLLSLSGLRDGDGVEVSLQEFLDTCINDFYFITLVGALFAELVSISVLGSNEKNSEPPTLV